MVDLPENTPVRREDGSLDIEFYSRRAVTERGRCQRLALAGAILLARRLAVRLRQVAASSAAPRDVKMSGRLGTS